MDSRGETSDVGSHAILQIIPWIGRLPRPALPAATHICFSAKRRRRWPVAFHMGYNRRRHRVENFFCRIKRFRRIATRYDKLACTFLAFVQFAAVLDWPTHRI
jgi:transposase